MITLVKILREICVETVDGLTETYVTVKFADCHTSFQEVEAVRVFRLPTDQARDAYLQVEYTRWLQSLDAVAEF